MPEFGTAIFFFQAEDGIRDLVRSRGLGDVYKRQVIIDYSLHEYYTFLSMIIMFHCIIAFVGFSL